MMAPPGLSLPDEKAIMQDLNPSMNESEGEVFRGFTKAGASPEEIEAAAKKAAEAQAA